MLKYTIMSMAASLLSLGAVAQSIVLSPYDTPMQLEALGMSDNHRYITGLNVASFCAFVWDTETGAVVESQGDFLNCDFRAITDDGRAFGILGADDMVTTYAAWLSADGEPHLLDTLMSACYDVTTDGTLAVGCLLDEMWYPTACYWKDGERHMLPCPTKAECGIANDGANAQFVSADGKVIVGYLQDDNSSRPALVWRLQADGSYQADVISKPFWELRDGMGKPYRRFEALGVSANGEWVCLALQGEKNARERAGRMNLLTGQVQQAECPSPAFYADDTCYPSGIADDGTVVGTICDASGFRRALLWRADSLEAGQLADAFPALEVISTLDAFMNHGIAISPDGRYICGYGCPVFQDELGEADYGFQSYLIDTLGGLSLAAPHVQAMPSASYDLSGRPVERPCGGLRVHDGRVEFQR